MADAALDDGFRARFGRAPAVAARAPGRVNLIGEHTDYNAGLVLPCAIDRDTRVLAAPRDDGRVRAWSRDLEAGGEFDTAALERRGDWLDYLKAVFFALAERGIESRGCDLAIASEVPRESGLSSSAALGVAVASAVDALESLGLDAVARARIVHRGESEFVGVGCGIMDQFASALGRAGHALRIDCRDERFDPIPLPADRIQLLIVHSGITRALARGDYRDRVAECHAALDAARRSGIAPAEAASLRVLTPADLDRLSGHLDPVSFRRVRHVVTENSRVDRFCNALRANDLESLGPLLREGQASLRDDFEVSTPELDFLCDTADVLPGVLGSRLTGAGFGGCTLHLVDPSGADDAGRALSRAYAQRFGSRPRLWHCTPSDGATATRL